MSVFERAKTAIEARTVLRVPPPFTAAMTALTTLFGLGSFAVMIATGSTSWVFVFGTLVGLLSIGVWCDIREAAYGLIAISLGISSLALLGWYMSPATETRGFPNIWMHAALIWSLVDYLRSSGDEFD